MRIWRKQTSLALVFLSGLAAGLALNSSALIPLVAEDVFSGALILSRRLASSYLHNDATPSTEQGPQLPLPQPTQPQVIWGLSGAFILFWIIRRRNRSAIKDLNRKDSLVSDGARMHPLAAQIPTAAPVEIPRALIQNPFSDGIDGVDFETRVQWAISGSLRHGRVLGVIHFEFVTSTVSVEASSSKLLNIRMIAIQKELKARLRSGDCVKITGEGKISVIIPLLSVRKDLERIADRLYVVALKAGAELELPMAYLPGCAMYPIDGYSFAELSQAAEDRAAWSATVVDSKSLPESAITDACERPHRSSLMRERVCDAQVTPRLAVIQYPRAPEEGPARRLIAANAFPAQATPTGAVQHFSASFAPVNETSCSAKPSIRGSFFKDAPQRVRLFIGKSKTMFEKFTSTWSTLVKRY